ncbi:MAG: glycosyltransferase family 2 protein [Pyrinomonadaceae bacterium]
MPVYNEAATISAIVDAVVRIPHFLELIIVDDCSSDGTDSVAADLARNNPKIRHLRHERNQGKTEALKTGFAQSKGDVVIVQDADLEYDPEEIADVIGPIINGHADVVYGSRFMVKKAARILYFGHYLANKALTFLSNCLTNLNMSDIETCYKAFRGDIIRNMTISSSGFGFEVEVTAKIAKLNCSIYEVPISYYGRTYEEGKKIGTRDGIAALFYIIRYNVFTSLKSSFQNRDAVLAAFSANRLAGEHNVPAVKPLPFSGKS